MFADVLEASSRGRLIQLDRPRIDEPVRRKHCNGPIERFLRKKRQEMKTRKRHGYFYWLIVARYNNDRAWMDRD